MMSGDVRQYYLQRKVQLSESKSSRLEAVAELDIYVKVTIRLSPIKHTSVNARMYFLGKNRRSEPI